MRKPKPWHSWFKQVQFYICGLVYMLVRIAVNVTMSFLPFYLIHVTGFIQSASNPTPVALALTPLVSYVTSLFFCLYIYKPMFQRFKKSRFYPLFLAIVVTASGSLPFVFLSPDPELRWAVYPLSAIQGIGLAIMLNIATSLISDVIGKNGESSAFVYGVYSFLDKVANGIIIFYLTEFDRH
jgi:Na+/melibiose symporter-like transporter